MSNRYPSQRGSAPPDFHGDMQSIRAAIDLLGQDMGRRLAALEAKFDALPQTYVMFREYSEALTVSKQDRSALSERVTAIEEWRLAQTQMQSAQLMSIQRQMTAADSSTQDQVSNVQQRASEMQTKILYGLVTVFGGALFGIITNLLARLIH